MPEPDDRRVNDSCLPKRFTLDELLAGMMLEREHELDDDILVGSERFW